MLFVMTMQDVSTMCQDIDVNFSSDMSFVACGSFVLRVVVVLPAQRQVSL